MLEKRNSLRSMSLKCVGLLAIALLATAGPAAAQVPMGTAFTYEGQLLQGGNPVNDTCEFEFSLWDDGNPAVPENQVGATLSETVIVEDGLLTVVLDFGADIFTGDARWLEIAVCCPPNVCSSPPTNFTTLSPRQELTPAPYSLRASNGVGGPDALNVDAAGNVGIGTTAPSEALDVVGNIQASGTLKSGSSIIIDGTANTITSDDALELHTSQGRNLRLEPGGPNASNRIGPNVIGGFEGNSVDAGILGATIAGGGADDLDVGEGPFPNSVTAEFGTVGGGYSNIASGFGGTVGGGSGNNASNDRATVGGGGGNAASGTQATVGGGLDNTAGGELSTVGGGDGNDAGGDSSTVGGGSGNTASGEYATVSGGWSNTANSEDATVAGGQGNTASEVRATVAGGLLNIASGPDSVVSGGGFNEASGDVSTIGGGTTNTASGDLSTVGGGFVNIASQSNATVGGGSFNHASEPNATVGGGTLNHADGENATVSGGTANTASGLNATVGGGNQNTASLPHTTVGGGTNNEASFNDATVGGGSGNTASGLKATVSGGQLNVASGTGSTISGGVQNVVGGVTAVVPGGWNNRADGEGSFAAGTWAQADHDGTFVWSDFILGSFTSTAPNQFLIRADGGVGIGLNNPAWALEVRGSGINLKNAGGLDRVVLTETPSSSGFVGTTGANGNANVWLSNAIGMPNLGHVTVFDANGDDNVRISGVIGAPTAGGIATYGSNGSDNIRLTTLVANADHGFISVYDAAGTQQAAMYVDAAGDGQVVSHDGTFSGNVSATTWNGVAKFFKIDHPLDPANKYLYHSSVESPDMMNVYNGNVVTDGNGEVWVELPVYFQALNQDFRYQLTVIGQFAQAIVGSKIRNNRFSIRTDKPNVEVSWQVTGVRKDAFAEAHRMVVEVDKPENERGHYLCPEVFGKSAELRISPSASAAVAAAPAGPAAPQAPAKPAPDFQGDEADLDPPVEE